jgi:hypothetical protein
MADVNSETVTVHRVASGHRLVELNREMWEPLPLLPATDGAPRRLQAHW